jgi:hypothetical protein
VQSIAIRLPRRGLVKEEQGAPAGYQTEASTGTKTPAGCRSEVFIDIALQEREGK